MSRAAWDQSHDALPGYSRGSAYGPETGSGDPTYAAVVGDDTIYSYMLNFNAQTSMASAKQRVRAELPPDAVKTAEQTVGLCINEVWSSGAINSSASPSYSGGRDIFVVVSILGFTPDPDFPDEMPEPHAILALASDPDPSTC